MPNSRFALHSKRPSLIHSLCTIFASNSRGLCAFFSLLLTPLSSLDSLFSATLSVHGLHFTVCTPSNLLFVITLAFFTKRFPPEDFLCSVVATGEVKELAVLSQFLEIYTKLIATRHF